MPAFRWYEKETGRTLVSNHPPDAAEIERRHSSGDGLLAAGGTSRGNMFSGDAPRCSATMSMIRDRKRSRSGDFFAYFADPYGFIRTIALSLADIAEERCAARRQRRSGAEHVKRGGLYPLVRAAIAVVMRDLTAAMLIADIVEGIPVSYATFVGYDEVAHHSGIREPDALRVLRRHDRQLARLQRAVAQAPRPYHLVALSDHGQTQGRPFRQRYGQTLEEVVKGRSRVARCARRRPSMSPGATSARCSPTPARTTAPGGRSCAARHAGSGDGGNSRARTQPRRPQRGRGGDRGRRRRDGLGSAGACLPHRQPRAAHARADRRGASAAGFRAGRASRHRLRARALSRPRDRS